MVQRRSPSLGVDHSRRHFVGEAATRGGCYHPSVGEPSRYQGRRGVTQKMDNKEVHAPRVNLIHR
jgi:hypothetical protein